ncbi:imidazolonepropionase [Rubrobacter taiwanensis]|jgi:imidazolonepropionase|uniref:Imidazolonepropionase n=1 Tax=Rubrobacter taiwanensis TaxID=185139 RepID=A0A4R1BLZ7_9ACTN|nr:imidazolonepropionase [Rubrobacter taiwanensis]TCJ18318.1 imidazolonepropionase [Rubrobacter taiwanensis]
MSGTTLFIHDLNAAVSPAGTGPLRGAALGELEVHAPASVAVSGEKILAVGDPKEVLREHPPGPDCVEVDGRGRVALPGLVDCHTHACFLGDRAREFELRAGGASYEELHAAGGGILSTVEATRAGSEAELAAAVKRHLDWMLEHGTTTAEVKSGYGLDRDSELKMLRAIVRAAAEHAVDVSPTFLGAHTVAPEFGSAAEHVEYLVREVLPEAARHASAADIFLERGSFEAPEARRYLEAARERGLALRLHGDQFSERGAVPLAVELGARSVDHLEATGEEGAQLLARSGVAAVLLPACALFLDLPLPPARALIGAGGIVALATDFNPGSAFCESLPLVMNLACTRLKMTPAEALAASTANAAHVLGLGDVGRLAPGYRADVLVLDAPDWRHLAYHLGGDRFAAKVKAGRLLA